MSLVNRFVRACEKFRLELARDRVADEIRQIRRQRDQAHAQGLCFLSRQHQFAARVQRFHGLPRA